MRLRSALAASWVLAAVAVLVAALAPFAASVEAQSQPGVRLFGTSPTGTPTAIGSVGGALVPTTPITCVVQTSTATALTAVGGNCVAPGATRALYITSISFSASAAGIAADAHPTLKSGTGGTCGSNTAYVWLKLSAAAVAVHDPFPTPIKVTANHELCWISSTAGSKAAVIVGFIGPA
jgi:hypothetical protein